MSTTLADRETGEVVDALSPMERELFAQQEAAIEDGAARVATSLRVIRDRRLYREDFTTFEAYCRERWGIGRAYANRQIASMEVAEILAPIGAKMIPEGQARELAPLASDPDKLRAVYEEAFEATGGKVTASAIKEARERPGKPETEAPDRGWMVELINDLRGPWRKGLTKAALTMTPEARAHVIATLQDTLNDLNEMENNS